jgi:hypothetical protein
MTKSQGCMNPTGVVCSIQQACEHLVGNRGWQKIPADIPTLENSTIHGFTLGIRERFLEFDRSSSRPLSFVTGHDHRSASVPAPMHRSRLAADMRGRGNPENARQSSPFVLR